MSVRVLVADDSELFRDVLSRVIASEPGFEVVAAAVGSAEGPAVEPAEDPLAG